MNLYVQSLTKYLKSEWDRALRVSNGPREARFIVQSLDPKSVFSLFQALDAHRLTWLQQQRITCHFRVAKGLWSEWCRVPGAEAQLHQEMVALGSIGPNGERLWIDEEDRLTWFRNRTTRDEGVDGLVVVLVGLNHATDQGGLADFHLVDELRIWRDLDESFIPWMKCINSRLDLGASDIELEQFDMVLQELFQLRPLRLGRLADFLERKVIVGGDFYSFADFTGRFFERLPFWGIPPLFADAPSCDLRGKKGTSALKEADSFISHQRYKTTAGRNKDWQKICNALSEAEYILPDIVDDEIIYEDVDAYRKTLHAFIHEADAEARTRLLKTNFVPLLDILRKREPGNKASKIVPSFTGSSFEVLLQGIWHSLEKFAVNCGTQPLVEQLSGIHVELVRFDHDLTDDDDEGVGANELARELLQGCLGGLDQVFEGMDCRLPQDEDQSRLPRARWNREVPITLDLALDTLTYGTSRARPNVQFKVTITSIDFEVTTNSVFKWAFGPTQPERVSFECAKKVRGSWLKHSNPERLLPAFQVPQVAMAALYFASDEDEANRLVSQAMTDLILIDLLDGLSPEQMDDILWELTAKLIAAYRAWLDVVATEGYYIARAQQMPPLLSASTDLAEKVRDTELLGSTELLRRFYKAFLLVDETVGANDHFLPGAIVWGLSPAVLELTQARAGYLADGFPEALGELAVGGDGRVTFDRLLDLAQIHRPLAALVVDAQQMSATIKSFGLLHYLGPEPPTSKSLAVQTLLRDEGNEDSEDVRDIVRPCEERDLVVRVLNDYQQLYPFAEDGLRILAVNVGNLQVILSGVDHFLEGYLKRTSSDWPPFHCTVMVYSTSSSPIAMENQLTLWRNHVIERQREKDRTIILSVGHRYAPKDQIIDLLKQEIRLYDIAFLFHFLRGDMIGKADVARPFEFDFGGWSGLQFPITEYPRPIRDGDRFRRQSLLSNRRLRIQARHADLSAGLLFGGNASADHVIFGHVDYEPWSGVVESLHEHAQWVVCVDPFVDKRLLCSEDSHEQRKIVGFLSGLGAYGELNLTISTEQDTLKQLTDQVAGKLTKLMPFEQPDGFESMAARMVGEAEEIIGLSSLRAVVGVDERIREVAGFAAVRRALALPQGKMSQLVPLDSLLHWFAGSRVTHRPDLVQLTLEVRTNDIPLVHAVLVECKFAQKNPAHVAKAIAQIQEGLQHLTGLLAPRHSELRVLGFDRRYWWAQLHRAMTSRSVVKGSEHEWRDLDHALESLAEGRFEICWQGVIFTFWTNEAGSQPKVTSLALPPGTVQPPFEIPVDFAIRHLELGYHGVSELFAQANPSPLIELNGPAIRLRLEKDTAIAEAPMSDAENSSIVTQEPGAPKTPPVTAIDHENRFTGVDTPPRASLNVRPEPMTGTVSVPDPPSNSTMAKSPTLVASLPSTMRVDESTTPERSPQASPVVAEPAFHVPEKVLIGTRRNNDLVYWNYGHPQLPNRHLIIFGTSGSGKTYGIQCLLAEMAQQQMHSLIVDYTDGFLPSQVEKLFLEKAKPQDHYVRAGKLPLNPFRKQSQIIDPSCPPVEESPFEVATRVASIFTSVFNTLGDQQSSTLIRILEEGVESGPAFSLTDMLSRLEAEQSQYGISLANKLAPLVKSQPFREGAESAWEGMLASPEHWVHVLQLTGLARDIQKMITEFVLWDLWDYAQNTGNKYRPIPIVLDEIQNLDHSNDSPIDKMLREGRKFGLSLILATQTTSQFKQEERDRLFQAGHKLFFKPATTEIDRFASILSQSTTGIPKSDWGQRLAKLEKGQCWSLGPVLQSNGKFKEEAVLVNVTALEERSGKG